MALAPPHTPGPTVYLPSTYKSTDLSTTLTSPGGQNLSVQNGEMHWHALRLAHVQCVMQLGASLSSFFDRIVRYILSRFRALLRTLASFDASFLANLLSAALEVSSAAIFIQHPIYTLTYSLIPYHNLCCDLQTAELENDVVVCRWHHPSGPVGLLSGLPSD